jgi:hypothetical protein
MGFLKSFRKEKKILTCPACNKPLDERHDAQFRIPVRGGFLMLPDFLRPLQCHSFQTVDLEDFQREVISRVDTPIGASETLQYLSEVAQIKADSLDWSSIKGKLTGKFWGDWGPHLRYMFLLTEDFRKKAEEWIDERYKKGIAEQTTEDLIGMLRKELRVTIGENIVDRLADLRDVDALIDALHNSCEYMRPRVNSVKDLKSTLLTISLAEALGRIGEEKGLEAINWIIENTAVLTFPSSYWLEILENAKMWIKAVVDENFEPIHKFLEQLTNEELFAGDGYDKLLKQHNKYKEWRGCAYILARNGDERVIPFLKKIYDLIDFYEKPRITKIIHAISSRSHP